MHEGVSWWWLFANRPGFIAPLEQGGALPKIETSLIFSNLHREQIVKLSRQNW